MRETGAKNRHARKISWAERGRLRQAVSRRLSAISLEPATECRRLTSRGCKGAVPFLAS